MKIAAILLCAGTGIRFQNSLPKQYLPLHQKKVYRHALDTLISSKNFCEIVLVIGKNHEQYLDPHTGITIVEGGKTRKESVFLALSCLKNVDFVMICEGARPFLTHDLIDAHIEKLALGEIAINTCIPCTDTINIQQNGIITSIPNRDQFLKGQTPQSFCFHSLFKAHKMATKDYSDDCAIMLDAGKNTSYVLGSESNIKITSTIDLKLARIIS